MRTERSARARRAAPSDLSIGLGAWQEWRLQLCPVVERLTETIRKNYESFDERTMPFMRVLHAALLMQHETEEYIVNVINVPMFNV